MVSFPLFLHHPFIVAGDSLMKRQTSDRSRIPIAAMALLLGFYGCGRGYSPEAHRVDPEQARKTLESVLTSWQLGETPQKWRQQDPEVVVQDMDWASGKKLEEFELLDHGEAIDANLHCRVRLKLVDPQQGEVEQTVTYLVTTSPNLTVFRSMTP
jgi:hypothetical protein